MLATGSDAIHLPEEREMMRSGDFVGIKFKKLLDRNQTVTCRDKKTELSFVMFESKSRDLFRYSSSLHRR